MAPILDRAVEADEIVTALRGYGLTQADIAEAVGCLGPFDSQLGPRRAASPAP